MSFLFYIHYEFISYSEVSKRPIYHISSNNKTNRRDLDLWERFRPSICLTLKTTLRLDRERNPWLLRSMKNSRELQNYVRTLDLSLLIYVGVTYNLGPIYYFS